MCVAACYVSVFLLASLPPFPSGCRSEMMLESLLAKRLAQLHPGLVQLGFAISCAASQDFSRLGMFVAEDVMEREDQPVSRRQFVKRALQSDAINGVLKLLVFAAQESGRIAESSPKQRFQTARHLAATQLPRWAQCRFVGLPARWHDLNSPPS